MSYAKSKKTSVASATSCHSWSNLMWVLFPEKEGTLIIHHCQYYQKNPPKSLFSFFPLWSQNFQCFSSKLWRGKKGNNNISRVYFPCWILEGSIPEFVSNLVGLVLGISVMRQNTPTGFLMKWSCNEKPYGEKCHVYCQRQCGAGLVSHTHRQCAMVLNSSTTTSDHFLRPGYCHSGDH